MDLNLSKSVMDLMFWGRLFHNFGAILFYVYMFLGKKIKDLFSKL